MKRLLYLLFTITLFTSCSSDDDPVISQTDTTFTIMQNQIDNQPNTVVGYLVDGKWKKVAELGDLKKGIPSKEIKVTDNRITEIYIFTDYLSPRKLDKAFNIKPNTKNAFELPSGVNAVLVSDKKDSTQYPQ